MILSLPHLQTCFMEVSRNSARFQAFVLFFIHSVCLNITLWWNLCISSVLHIVNLFFSFLCSVLKCDRSENLPGWMGHLLCQMVTSPGSDLLQAKAESCRWYVQKETTWACGSSIFTGSQAHFVVFISHYINMASQTVDGNTCFSSGHHQEPGDKK